MTIIEIIEQLTAEYFVEYPYITGILSVVILEMIFLMLYNVFYSLEYLIRGGK